MSQSCYSRQLYLNAIFEVILCPSFAKYHYFEGISRYLFNKLFCSIRFVYLRIKKIVFFIYSHEIQIFMLLVRFWVVCLYKHFWWRNFSIKLLTLKIRVEILTFAKSCFRMKTMNINFWWYWIIFLKKMILQLLH